MRTVTAGTSQTLFDIALQEMGSIEGIFELLAVNPSLALDTNIPPLTELNIPASIINRQVVDYYSKNNIKPATGIEEQITTEQVVIHQELNYDLGTVEYVEFDPVELPDFSGTLNVDVFIEGTIEQDTVEFTLEYLFENIWYTNGESFRFLTGSFSMILSSEISSNIRCIINVSASQQATLREIVYSYEKPI